MCLWECKKLQTFSSGYTVFLQTVHFSCVPENMPASLLGALALSCDISETCIQISFSNILEDYEKFKNKGNKVGFLPTCLFHLIQKKRDLLDQKIEG